MCVYLKQNHPGCAIGCQPGFRETFGHKGKILKETTIEDLVYENSDIRKFFNVCDDVESDIDFLMDLQYLHDNSEHWDKKFYTVKPLRHFVENGD